MKTTKDILLESKISDMILVLVREAKQGKLDIPNGDVQAICAALAMQIINIVRTW